MSTWLARCTLRNRVARALRTLAWISLAHGLISCGDAASDVSGGELLFDATPGLAVPVPAAKVSLDGATGAFSQVYAEIINGSAGCNGCHSPPGAAGNLDMSSKSLAYENLVGKPATSAAPCAKNTDLLVDPAHAMSSLLYLKVTHPPCGSQMPLGGSSLTLAQVRLIGGWIDEGAKND